MPRIGRSIVMEANDDSTDMNVESARNQLHVHAKFKFRQKHSVRLVLRLLALVLAIGGVIGIVVAGYMGFVPGLSKALGAQSPRALGVTYSDADYERYLAKSGVSIQDASLAPDDPKNPGKKLIFSQPRTLSNAIFTQEEITAAINSIGWVWMPLQNAQVRFSDDNIIEVSGKLNVKHIDDFMRFIGGVGYSEADVNRVVGFGEKFVGNAAVYIKTRAHVKDGIATVEVMELQVGRYTVPLGIANRVIQNGTNNAMARTPEFKLEEAHTTNTQLHFSGTYPSTVYVKTTEK